MLRTEVSFSTKRESGGTGLGLYLSYTIIKREGGDILARSRMGSGTTFTVRLPMVKNFGATGPGELA